MTAVSGSLPVVTRADAVPGPAQGCWTYEAYAALPDDGRRYEVIDGVLLMAPAPNTEHQDTVGGFTTELRLHVQRTGLGRVFPAPVDVLLPLSPPVVVQPDIVVVLAARAGIITSRNIQGAPDLVIEVASPGTATYDRRTKLDRYARAGVREYWIADPASRTVEVFWLEHGEYVSAGVFEGQATLPSRVLPDLPSTVETLF